MTQLAGRAIAASAVLAFAGCSGDALPPPQCFEAKRSLALSDVEQAVLADARTRSRDECAGATEQCDFDVRVLPDGGFAVIVEFAIVDPETNECLYLAGGFAGHVYDASGEYVRTMPGL